MKPAVISLLALCVSISGCKNTPRSQGQDSRNYFPSGTFDEFVNDWYSNQLEALGEPSVYAQKDNKDRRIFRFTWLRTFHNPVSIRLEIPKEGTGLIYCRMTSGDGGYEPGRIKRSYEKEINRESIDKFLSLIDEETFWSLPTTGGDIGMDGSQWIIEGVSDGKYHLVDRWTPEEGSVREIGMALLTLSGLEVEEIY